MKRLLALIFILLVTDVWGQSPESPLYYLNGEDIGLESVYILPKSIEEIKVIGKPVRNEIHIITKPAVVLLTLDEILTSKTGYADTARQMVYIIDGKLIPEKSKVRVDASHYIAVEIKRLDDLNYIRKEYKDLMLVEIKLYSEKPKPVIRIRGEQVFKSNGDGNYLKHNSKSLRTIDTAFRCRLYL